MGRLEEIQDIILAAKDSNTHIMRSTTFVQKEEHEAPGKEKIRPPSASSPIELGFPKEDPNRMPVMHEQQEFDSRSKLIGKTPPSSSLDAVGSYLRPRDLLDDLEWKDTAPTSM